VIDLHHPIGDDVLEVIRADHRAMEDLLRLLRDASTDRDAVRHALAEVLVAHAEAEERFVYPVLRRRDAVSAHDAEHGREEHAEGHEALLAVLELVGTDTDAFDDAVEQLSTAINHHLAEEELTILNPSEEVLGSRARRDLAHEFCTERNRLITEGCGSVEQVRTLVERAQREDLLDD